MDFAFAKERKVGKECLYLCLFTYGGGIPLSTHNLRDLELILGIAGVGLAVGIVTQQVPALAGTFGDSPALLLWIGLAAIASVVQIRRLMGITFPNVAHLTLVTVLLCYGTAPALLAGLAAGIASVTSSRTSNSMLDSRRVLAESGKHTLGLLVSGLVLWGTAFHNGALQTGFGHVVFIRVFAAYAAYTLVRLTIESLRAWVKHGTRPTERFETSLSWKTPVDAIIPIASYLLGLACLAAGVFLICALAVVGMIRILMASDDRETKHSLAGLVGALRLACDGHMLDSKNQNQLVMDLAMGIGRAMKLPRKNLDLLEQAAMLHDVGYIDLDPEMVLKPTELTQTELNSVREHPVRGMRILAQTFGTESAGDIVLLHHESPDGTGYPCGLTTPEIPIEAAIIKVAEAFVAMTSPRAYRKQPLTHEEALHEIAEAAGHVFDSAVAYYFFEMIERYDLSSNVASKFGAPCEEHIQARLYKAKPKRAVMAGRSDRMTTAGIGTVAASTENDPAGTEKASASVANVRAMFVGAGLVAASIVSIPILSTFSAVLPFGPAADQTSWSVWRMLCLLFIVGLTAREVVRLPWGAYVSASSAIALVVALAGGPIYALVFGIALIGWMTLVRPPSLPSRRSSDALLKSKHAEGHHTRARIPATDGATAVSSQIRRKTHGWRPLTGTVYGLVLVLAGISSWAAYSLGSRLAQVIGGGWLHSELLSAGLAVGTFWVVEITAQSILLSRRSLSPARLWHRNYLGILPEPLSYVALGYALFLTSGVIGLPMALLLYFLPVVWRHLFLSRRIKVLIESERLTRAVVHAIDERDLSARHESADVAELAVATAREMGKDEVFVEQLEKAAILHDVGKVSWPDQLLQKRVISDSENLEDYKWAHPQFSADIAVRAGTSRLISDMIRFHHEHYDGGGYPEGLKGDDIPIGARIICVADSFDAMIHDRVYGPRLTVQQAAEELKRCSGTQFDPNVIKAFLRVLSKLDLEEPARHGGIVAEHLTEETAEETETAAECESGYLVKE